MDAAFKLPGRGKKMERLRECSRECRLLACAVIVEGKPFESVSGLDADEGKRESAECEGVRTCECETLLGNEPESGEGSGGAKEPETEPTRECARVWPFNVDRKGEDGCPFAPFDARGGAVATPNVVR